MIVSSSWPEHSSASKSMPTPSSTAAIMHARCRTSSWPPEWIAAWSCRAFSVLRSSKASAHAGLLLTTSAGGRLLGVGMHGLVGEEERPRPIVATTHELHGHLVHDVRDIAYVLHVAPALVQGGIVEPAVTVVADPHVVPGTRLAVVAHVPLADVRRLVAQLLQLEVIVGQAVARRVARHVVDNAVAARVLAGEDGRAVGGADGRGVERPVEEGTLVGDAIGVRRFHVGMAARAELVEAKIVDEDKEDVRPARRHQPEKV